MQLSSATSHIPRHTVTHTGPGAQLVEIRVTALESMRPDPQLVGIGHSSIGVHGAGYLAGVNQDDSIRVNVAMLICTS